MDRDFTFTCEFCGEKKQFFKDKLRQVSASIYRKDGTPGLRMALCMICKDCVEAKTKDSYDKRFRLTNLYRWILDYDK